MADCRAPRVAWRARKRLKKAIRLVALNIECSEYCNEMMRIRAGVRQIGCSSTALSSFLGSGRTTLLLSVTDTMPKEIS